ncbi:MAG: hypothetical protein ABI237_02890 [Ginsengibacter sp.]
MKQKIRKGIIIIVSVIILCNLPPVKWPFTWFDHDDYRYSNNDGSFTYEEFQFQERDFKMGWGGFLYFKENCKCSDTILYRLNRNNPFKFWRYGDYIFKKKYHLPYQSWVKIKVRRGPIDHLEDQDF